ncbi:hypothetical protein HOLleu_35535 [Holothuria leucospilota]|uniref:Uncharacterized protein n=1 Tax=Holothuria leucospilota TaxID=206669 RepID=A0A9Q0YQ46_HOLLE|nr:hypothetical protein HOLleu_35535 [Holothuria leucospilota]
MITRLFIINSHSQYSDTQILLGVWAKGPGSVCRSSQLNKYWWMPVEEEGYKYIVEKVGAEVGLSTMAVISGTMNIT